MKSRHAAALALVVLAGCTTGMSAVHPTGWLMMLPPKSQGIHQTNGSLDGWTPAIAGITYGGKEQCEQFIEIYSNENRREGSPPGR